MSVHKAFQAGVELEKLLNQFVAVERDIIIFDPAGKKRGPENDAEHTYKAVMLALRLLPELYPRLSQADKLETIYALLGHDLVEIEAGDTSAWADQALIDSQAEREAAALENLLLINTLPLELKKAVANYYDQSTLPARIALAIDKLEPLFTNIATGGAGWKTLKITQKRCIDKTREKMSKVKAPEFLPLFETAIRHLEQHPEYFYT